MKLTVSQVRDGALVLSCGDGGAEVDLVFAAGAMHGDPRLDGQRAILDAIVALQTKNERMQAALRGLMARLDPHDYPDEQGAARAALEETA